ncbi:MAG: hypothetical protein L3K07_01610 [Thermoplasmata archaeon]|nr:hypothetical protein [Thermoplasmata archaeon]
MAERPAPVRLTVERELPATGASGTERVRLSRELEPGADGLLTPERLSSELASLRTSLDSALRSLGLAGAPARERPLEELLDTYRPRQGELVELLREDGEITEREYGTLRAYLDGGAASASPGAFDHPDVPSVGRPIPERPIAAAPLEGDRTPTTARAVSVLLETFQITSLKQAGAVRARRQISYDEYMALKRHFSRTEATPSANPST